MGEESFNMRGNEGRESPKHAGSTSHFKLKGKGEDDKWEMEYKWDRMSGYFEFTLGNGDVFLSGEFPGGPPETAWTNTKCLFKGQPVKAESIVLRPGWI